MTGENKEHLSAYVVPVKGDKVPAALKEYLSKSLPEYMVPSYVVPLETIPVTSNGKIDRKRLPDPASYTGEGNSLQNLTPTYVAPETELEKQVAGVWRELLKLERVGTSDNFFNLGGNSLNVIQLKSKLDGLLNRDIPVTALFENVTISSFALYWRKEEGEDGRNGGTKQSQSETAFWFIQAIGPCLTQDGHFPDVVRRCNRGHVLPDVQQRARQTSGSDDMAGSPWEGLSE